MAPDREAPAPFLGRLTPLSTLHSPLCLFGEGGPLAVDEVIPPAIRAFTPLLGRPHLRSVNGARDSTDRPPGKVSLLFERAIVLPLEGKGDRFAVDEVKMRTAPLRGACNSSLLTPHSSLFFQMSPKNHEFQKIP